MHNRSAHAAFTGFGKCVSNKQIVIFSKMTLLATTSSTTEKKISKQGFCLSKFRMPVDAILSSMATANSETCESLDSFPQAFHPTNQHIFETQGGEPECPRGNSARLQIFPHGSTAQISASRYSVPRFCKPIS